MLSGLLMKNIMTKSSWYIISILFITGCSSVSELNPEEYLNFYINNADVIVNKKNIGTLYFKATYLSPEYMALKMNKSEKYSDSLEFEIKDRSNFFYFNFEIGENESGQDVLNKDISTPEELFSRIEYLSFKVQNDFMLLVGNDTFPCLMSQYERTFGLNKSIVITCMFERVNPFQDRCPDITLEFYDNLFRNGYVKLAFDGDKICELPKLNIYNHDIE